MPMSPRLLRPRASGINADAADWVSRVVANGGTVSGTTVRAVDTFCSAIEAAGIRDRFLRLNLMCGTGLNAALVPLYRGVSLGGTQLGNVTDTNVGPFVSGDYSESNGLQATATGNEAATKSLDCGTNIVSALPNSFSGHQSLGIKLIDGAVFTNQHIMSNLADADSTAVQVTQYRHLLLPTRQVDTIIGGTNTITRAAIATNTRHFLVTSRPNQTAFAAFLNGGSKLTGGSIPTNRVIRSDARLVPFATANASGGGVATFRHIIFNYSFGLSMTDAQVEAFSTAVATINTTLGRT